MMSVRKESPLITDLYQLTMLKGYFDLGMEEVAVFEFFVRDLPEKRNFLVAAGLEQVLDFLEGLHFSAEDLGWLKSLGLFSEDFIEYLGGLRFGGDIHAMPEGTIFFPDEPILRVTAPLPQAQLVETRIINLLHFQTLIASKAVRMQLAAPGRQFIDFGLRRAHGSEAGLMAARASYLAGFSGTSTLLAGQVFDIPVFGTMAHSFVQAHDTEVAAFENFAVSQPGNVTLLIDTYDTEAGARKVVGLAPELQKKGISIRAVRLDSGDLVEHSRRVRRILDNGGLKDVRIFTSGNLDEYVLKHFSDNNAPIDAFGIGTMMVTSSDAPYLNCAYKLQEYAGIPRRKRSEGKATWPGAKQVYRCFDRDGIMSHDILTLNDDLLGEKALLKPVMQNGMRIGLPVPLVESREYLQEQMKALPPYLRRLDKGPDYPVRVSQSLRDCTMNVDKRTLKSEHGEK